MRVVLANPRGFCAGVDRAIEIVERALETFGRPIHVRHEVVHNRSVVERLRGLGAVFVDELDEVPDDATVIFSAHGVSKAVEDEAARRGLKVFDATCPLVTKVHMEVVRYAREGFDVVLQNARTPGSSQGGRIQSVSGCIFAQHREHGLKIFRQWRFPLAVFTGFWMLDSQFFRMQRLTFELPQRINKFCTGTFGQSQSAAIGWIA